MMGPMKKLVQVAGRRAAGLEELVEAYYKGHIVVLRRMVQLTSDKTFDNIYYIKPLGT